MTPGELHQLHIGIERYRAPELLFKPYMIGSSEAGLSEVIDYVISRFSSEDQSKLAENIVVTGSLAQLPGLRERLLADMISFRPFKSVVNIKILPNPGLSAWYGAKSWTEMSSFKKSVITRQQYEEFGGEFLTMHIASNYFHPSPKEQVVDVDV